MSKILVLDDNEAILEAIHFILSRRKIVVVTIADPTLLLPIVLFSAKSYNPASITACGADAFMEKPFHIQNLYTVLEQLLPQEA